MGSSPLQSTELPPCFDKSTWATSLLPRPPPFDASAVDLGGIKAVRIETEDPRLGPTVSGIGLVHLEP